MSALSLMVQGTMSNVGKSVLVAGLCRVLAQDGYRVAPFKSQNMALNSFITPEGAEIGRAQAMQAEAAGIDPVASMNPVLLKPTTDVGSQVIVNGHAVGTMPACEYFRYRATLKEPIMEAYQELARAYDVVLIEGAGSPVELNLKRDDIVNMGIAQLTHSPVLLVGDIDRGGVFAQLVGILMLLDDDERPYVKATVVNKFRGDPTLFCNGMEILRQRTGLPVAGLVPYLQLDLDDEDSVSGRLDVRTLDAGTCSANVDVAVIRLPKISNFTDFNVLDAMGGVRVRYVASAAELGTPDLIIVPGTKATIADLQWMRERGLADAVVRAARAGVPTFGICGGYQMLGTCICDPQGMEGGGEVAGLGLLPVRTTFERTKRQAQVDATFCEIVGPLSALSGARVHGYEIHLGRTTREGGQPLVAVADGAKGSSTILDGCQQGNVYGCYLHGLFDSAETNRALVRALFEAKGLGTCAVKGHNMDVYRQRQYDLLADGIRAHMDMDLVYKIIRRGV